jgi:signal transduction histidine kinase/ActR/RegA family two-component response regulator
MGVATCYWTIFDATAGVAQAYTYAYMYTLRSIMLVIAPICFLRYMLYLSGAKFANKKAIRLLFWIIPISDIILLVTNPLHRLIFAKDGFPLPEYGTLFGYHAAIAYVAILIGVVLLFRYIAVEKPPWLFAAGWILSCMIPIVVNVLFTFGVISLDQDVAPFGFALIFILFSLYSYRSRLSNLRTTALGDVFNSYKNAIVILNSNNVIEDVNAAFRSYFPGVDIMPQKTNIRELYAYFEAMAKDEDSAALFEAAREDGMYMASGEYVFGAEGSKNITFDVGRQDVKSAGGRKTGYLLTFSDISEYRSMIKEINDQNERLALLRDSAEEASAAKSTFLASMSHEMRTPLNAIIGLSELVLRKDLEASTHDSIEKVYDSGKNLLATINDILDIAKIEAGHLELVPVEYDTATMINDAVNLNKVRIGTKPIEFLIKSDPALPKRLYGDELRVRQVLNNLLSNAIKYTKEGEVELSVTVVDSPALEAGREGAVGRRGDEIRIKFSVRDTGIGIREEDMPQLFAEYQQFDKKANRKVEGTGLGLPISGRLSELMGGEIEVESEYGKGSIFSVELHQTIVDATPIGMATSAALKNSSYSVDRRAKADNFTFTPMPYASVLIVDDMEINLEVAKGMLEPYLLHIDCAEDGAKAVKLVRDGNRNYDLIFMDQMMPGMDGIEAVRVIREEIGTDYAQSVPIVALTANAMSGSKEMFLEKGFQDFLAKPIDPKQLNEILINWIVR